MNAVTPIIATGRPAESAHWYAKDGSCCYEIEAKKGGMRPVTLRDARKLNLVPSVTAIIQMEARPALERWKIEQALLSALTLPRLDGEDEGAFMERALDDSREQARKAAERGTRIHGMLQGYFEGAPVPSDALPYVMPVEAWLKGRYGGALWECERSFAHSLGFGGKSDLIERCIPAVIDFKVKDFGEDKQARDLAWPEHGMQLAAYARGHDLERADCLNIFVSTKVPGLIRVREWDAAEIELGWRAFCLLLELWQIRKEYRCAF